MELSTDTLFAHIGVLYVQLKETERVLTVTQQSLEATAKERDTLKAQLEGRDDGTPPA